jgi:hypothetical protein
LFLLIGVLVVQAWLTLSLFGPEQPWDRLLDDQPIISGRHPLHLYHGTLGARSLLERGTLCCYDPGFQAGYPKTPVFDSGSRPAELFLLLAGGNYRPAAYKIGVAILCLLAPLIVALAGASAGLNRVSACLASALAVLVWWGDPCRSALEAGQIDLLLATLAAVAQVGLLIRFDRAPGPLTWIGILISGYLGWFAHPLFFALGLPLALIYYLTVGPRHRLIWHLALLVGLAGALLSNGFWLLEWVRSWWIQAPPPPEPQALMSRTLQSLWEATLWGQVDDRALGLFLGVLGLVGVICFNQARQRVTARLLGLSAAGFVLLAVAATVWPPLEHFSPSTLATPALLFLVIPAVHALRAAVRLLARWTGDVWVGAFIIAALLAGLVSAGYFLMPTFAARFMRPSPFSIGLGEERLAIAETLRQQTTNQGRILWEDLEETRADGGGSAPDKHWTPLLPLLTDRAFLGGLDPEAHIEHSYASFTEGVLANHPIAEWSDASLMDFCQRYNVGWVVCHSPNSAARFRNWSAAQGVSAWPVGGQVRGGWLFRIERTLSFALKGHARWLSADAERIVLADVVPENGEVVLSLHFHEGLRASPGRVLVQRERDKDRDPIEGDPIDFVRLRLAAPAVRLTLIWRR